MKKLVFALAVSSALAACTTDPYTGQPKVANTTIGAGLGAAAGAVGGLIYAEATDASSVGKRNAILIGAGIGALTGGGVGAYMDRQEAELRQQLRDTGVSVTRNGNDIKLNMPSNITFAVDQDQVQSNFQPTLNSVAIVLKKYNKTIVDVSGFTDSTGSESYNLDLSRRRALSVANYLVQQGTDGRRYAVSGYGESQPVASNDSEAGRAANRRVEIQIRPITQG